MIEPLRQHVLLGPNGAGEHFVEACDPADYEFRIEQARLDMGIEEGVSDVFAQSQSGITFERGRVADPDDGHDALLGGFFSDVDESGSGAGGWDADEPPAALG